MTGADTELLPLSAECALAVQPGYQDLHRACRQTKDIPLPHAIGIWLVRRCGCAHHADQHRQPAPAPTPTSTARHLPERERP